MHRDKPITVATYREGVPEGIAASAFYKRIGFTEGKLNDRKRNCPCKKTRCERNGNCNACRAYHAGSKRKRPCERMKDR